MADSTSTTTGISYDPSWAARGITQDVWNSLNAAQQATIGSTLEAGAALVANTGQTVSMGDAMIAAATDPSIISKYSDALSIDKTALTQNLQQLQTTLNTTNQNNEIQFQSDRKALADAQAQAGTAYSGFRGEAQKNLQTQEAGIVTSTNAQAQQQLNQMQQQFESKYGTTATPSLTLNTTNADTGNKLTSSGLLNNNPTAPTNITGTNVGGSNIGGLLPATPIIGSATTAQQSDVANLAANTYSTGQQKATVAP